MKSNLVVELRAARIPGLSGWFADHHWLLILTGVDGRQYESCDRWEIWQYREQAEHCWGHLHKNLLIPSQGVGNGPSRSVRRWSGADAHALTTRIEDAPNHYPFCDDYGYWPGPNSNTFAQWVLAGRMKLGMRAIGRRYQLPKNAG